MQYPLIAIWYFALFAFGNNFLAAQELGSVRNFGEDGRLFYAGQSDYYLLSSKVDDAKDYSWTDYSGQVRLVRHYAGGGYEIVLKDYNARCGSALDSSFVAWQRREGEAPVLVDINPSNVRPKESEKESYNLYWAVCFGKFQRMR